VFGLVDAATDDHIVTHDELDTLLRVAHALDVDQSAVQLRIEPYMRRQSTVTLAKGMTVVITGDHAVYERSYIAERLTDLGLEVVRGVNKSTELLAAADVSSSSGKAKKARQYRIPIVSVDDLLNARLGSTIEAVAVSEAMKVVQCPDCHATWTVSGRAAVHSSRRCDDCAPIAAPKARKSTAAQPTTGGAWAPPNVEWLVCEQCQTRWHRQVTRGRKPRLCASCS
jgi:DNA polymerase-3 subunit epsilon